MNNHANHFPESADNAGDASSAFSNLLDAPVTRTAQSPSTILIGTLIQVGNGEIQIRSLEGDIVSGVAACALGADDTGKQCAFMVSEALNFAAVIVGLLQHPLTIESPPAVASNFLPRSELDYPEGLKITCGKSSITLDPDGKVEIRGTRIINQASESHRIKAGSVRIN